MEQEQDSAGTTGVSRGQNHLHLLPEDWQSAATVIEPLLDRLETANSAPQLLVLTSDPEAAAGIAGRIAAAGTKRGLRTLAATDARRAARVHRAFPSPVVVGPAGVLVELLQSAVLKLDAVRVVALAWVDDMSGAETRALETLMAELPKEAARSVLASAMTPAVEHLVERYARRARRMQAAASESGEPLSLSFVAAGESARSEALRRILDALDPESAVVVTRNAESRRSVERLLRSLGYDGASGSVRVSDTPDAKAQLIVLYDLPATEEELRGFERGSARIVALVSARQVPALRRLAGGAVTPLALPEAAARAQTREAAVRDELRRMLSSGQYSRELLALEPLLADYDGSEVAAAALRLLEIERAKPQAPTAPAGQPAMTRLYLNVGEMDNVRPADLVGAITSEAGIAKTDLGRVDVRERHSTVEVATPVANAVVSKLTGVTIKGRRALVKIDEGEQRDRGPRRDRERPPRDRGGPPRDRGGPPRDRDARPPRDRSRPERRPPRPRTDRD